MALNPEQVTDFPAGSPKLSPAPRLSPSPDRSPTSVHHHVQFQARTTCPLDSRCAAPTGSKRPSWGQWGSLCAHRHPDTVTCIPHEQGAVLVTAVSLGPRAVPGTQQGAQQVLVEQTSDHEASGGTGTFPDALLSVSASSGGVTAAGSLTPTC